MSIYRRSRRGNGRPWVTQTWLDEGSVGHDCESLSMLYFSQHAPSPHSQNAPFLQANLILFHYAIPHHLNLSLSSQQLIPFPACPALAWPTLCLACSPPATDPYSWNLDADAPPCTRSGTRWQNAWVWGSFLSCMHTRPGSLPRSLVTQEKQA